MENQMQMIRVGEGALGVGVIALHLKRDTCPVSSGFGLQARLQKNIGLCALEV